MSLPLAPELQQQGSLESAPRVVGSRWELHEILGKGGMGTVYRGRHRITGQAAAIKILEQRSEEQEHRLRCERELQLAAAVSHPGIVQVFDAGEDLNSGDYFLAMELLVGETLSDCLEQQQSAEEPDVRAMLRYLRLVLEPLAAAHAAGIAHRDLKPDNVFVQSAPNAPVKLLDFGIAREEASPKLTQTGAAIGTPGYMSPEQAMGQEITPATDVWAIGVMLYEILTGHHPFQGDTAPAVIVAACTRPHRAVMELAPGTDRALAVLVDQCLEKDPTRRPKHAGELLLALNRALGNASLPPSRKPPSLLEAVGPRQAVGKDPRQEGVPGRERTLLLSSPVGSPKGAMPQGSPQRADAAGKPSPAGEAAPDASKTAALTEPSGVRTIQIAVPSFGPGWLFPAGIASLALSTVAAAVLAGVPAAVLLALPTVLLLAFWGFLILRRRQAGTKLKVASAPRSGRAKKQVEQNAPPSLGADEAPISIVFCCDLAGASSKRAKSTLDRVLLAHGHDVRVAFRHAVKANFSTQVAEAGAEAFAQGGAAAFWRFVDLLLGSKGKATPARCEVLFREVGLNVAALHHGWRSQRHRVAIHDDLELVETLGVHSFPAFLVQGRVFEGETPAAVICDAIDAALAPEPSPTEAQTQMQGSADYRDWCFDQILIHWSAVEGSKLVVPRSRAEAKERAERLGARAQQSGADFSELARTFGDGPLSVEMAELPPGVWGAAARLSHGQVSDVLESQDGFHILRRR